MEDSSYEDLLCLLACFETLRTDDNDDGDRERMNTTTATLHENKYYPRLENWMV